MRLLRTIRERRPSTSMGTSSATVRAAISSASRDPATYPLRHQRRDESHAPAYPCVAVGAAASGASPGARGAGLIAAGVRWPEAGRDALPGSVIAGERGAGDSAIGEATLGEPTLLHQDQFEDTSERERTLRGAQLQQRRVEWLQRPSSAAPLA